jgi:hypothetical protein
LRDSKGGGLVCGGVEVHFAQIPGGNGSVVGGWCMVIGGSGRLVGLVAGGVIIIIRLINANYLIIIIIIIVN